MSNPTREDATRSLIAASERLHHTAQELRKWAAGYLPGDLPAVIQAVIDAADFYENELDSQPTTEKGESSPGHEPGPK